MTRHPDLTTADGRGSRGWGVRRDGPEAAVMHLASYAGPGGRPAFAAGPAGSGIIRLAGRAGKRAPDKYRFARQVVDNPLNNDVHVQADLVPTNT